MGARRRRPGAARLAHRRRHARRAGLRGRRRRHGQGAERRHGARVPRQVERVLNGIGRGKTPGQPAVVDGDGNDTGTIALIVAIVAMLTALAAMTIVAVRQTRPVMRA